MDESNFLLAALPAEVAWDYRTLGSVVLFALGYLLVQTAGTRVRPRVALGVLFLLAGIGLAASRVGTTVDELLLVAFSALAAAGAVLFLVFRQPVHSALGFALAVLATCGLFFLPSAPFLAAATMVVYAGATIIIFLFVLMFAQHSTLEPHDLQPEAPRASVVVASLLAIILLHAVHTPHFAKSPSPDLLRPQSNETQSAGPGRVIGLGRSLFTDYLWCVELAGTLLLVAGVGAIAISQKSSEAEA